MDDVKTSFLYWSLRRRLGCDERIDWRRSCFSRDHDLSLRTVCRSRKTLLASWPVVYSLAFLKYECFLKKSIVTIAHSLIVGGLLSGIDVSAVEMVH